MTDAEKNIKEWEETFTKLKVKYSARARLRIKQKISKKTGIEDEKQIDKITDYICKLTDDSIRKKYFLEGSPIFVAKKKLYDPIFSIENKTESQDFHHWALMIYYIPFYQSLGDTIGYRNGLWEFKDKNLGPEYAYEMLSEFISLGGINGLSIVNWLASDDTIMYIKTYDIACKKIKDVDDFGTKCQKTYLASIDILKNRAPGITTIRSLQIQENIKWDKLHYDSTAIGAGSAMRTGCIGIYYPGSPNRKRLIALATENSRITHNSAMAILGSITTALFTAYAIEKIPISYWPHKLIRFIKGKKIDTYLMKSRPAEYNLYVRDRGLFLGQWEKYVSFRFAGLVPRTDLRFMNNPVQRIKYLSENFSKGNENFPGSKADDVGIIAYDALLESGDNLEKLLVYSILHNGDSDTVGSVAFSWFGAYHFSYKNGELALARFEQLEFAKSIRMLFINGFNKLVKVYYHDLYVNFARKFIKKLE